MADRKHMPFVPRVAIVTGAASGIGFECARAMAAAGARVALVDRAKEALDNAVARAGAH